ncbi:MAG: polysaccharide deacetylase family protein, partial [Acidimicrobiia bacterium]|nr:polysaccharide deacetylase family protein [Acidimicrobiia bacterium]
MAANRGGMRAVKVERQRTGATFTRLTLRVLVGLIVAASTLTLGPGSTSATANLERPVVYFTFDDGPDATVTGRILDVLARYDARATFFIVGSRLGAYPTVARRIVDEGHAMANHSHTHPVLTSLSDASIRYQFRTASDAIRAVTGVTPSCYRPPYGAVNERVHRLAVESGLPNADWTAGSSSGNAAHYGLWDVDTLDWRLSYSTTWSQLSKVSAGDVVLMHSLRSFSADVFARWMADNAHRFRFEALPGCGGRTEPPLPADPAYWYRYQVARLYVAYFRRPPEYEGAKYWNTLYGSGRLGLVEMSDLFARSTEFANRYQSLNQREFVALVYRNVLGREPDQRGWDYWTALMNRGVLTRGELMVLFSES